MNLDGIKDKVRQVKAPPVGRADQENGSRSLADLIVRLRAADDRMRGGMRKALPLYAIAVLCWLLVLVVMTWFPPRPRPASEVLFWIVLTAIYFLLTTALLRRLRRMAKIDYTSPTRQFLAAAEQRYAFMRPEDYWVAGVGCLLLGVVAGTFVVNLMTRRYFGPEHHTLIMVLYAVSYLGLCAIGFTFTYRNWKQSQRALWFELRQMLAEFDQEEAAATQGPVNPVAAEGQDHPDHPPPCKAARPETQPPCQDRPPPSQ
ncbi:MAG TPA: hypothetical protein PKY77_12685 [Phycisphaerae bacterium]|nr:hypothetical protein [Phycisphaerae bacterium]HRY69185.1 hypothetical protein [Phycisphaerae bacterium]HSA26146.1 hypothetical protein [Phycisphaerae bacterium]